MINEKYYDYYGYGYECAEQREYLRMQQNKYSRFQQLTHNEEEKI
jgi:hypothetical protein